RLAAVSNVITRAGRGSSSRSKNNKSTPEALREKMLKLTPPAVTVAPRGEHRPALTPALAPVRFSLEERPRSRGTVLMTHSCPRILSVKSNTDLTWRPQTQASGLRPVAKESSGCALEFSVSADQVVCRAVVRERRFGLAFYFRNDALGQNLAKFHAPLVERVDLPNCALGKYRMFVKRDELAENLRREPGGKDGVRGTTALEDAMRDEPIRRAFGLDLLRRLAEGQCFGLGEDVCQEHVMMAAERIERLSEGNKVAGNKAGALMD